MTGDFTVDWLALREPVDARSRASVVTARAVAWAGERRSDWLSVVDLGAGTGSNLRYLAPRLLLRQRWRLVDRNTGLLAAAEGHGGPPTSHGVQVATVHADLAVGDLSALIAGSDLITASALFDLVSGDWCETVIAAIAKPGKAILAVLTYDGSIVWDPPLPDDAFVADLVNRDQRRDKGFGPALGPEAATVAPAVARALGARVTAASSVWQLGPADAALHGALLKTLAAAASEQAPTAAGRIGAWLRARLHVLGRSRLTVGHIDLFAEW